MNKITLPTLSLLSLLAAILLAGCTTGGTPPLASTPPAPYLIVPKKFFAVADSSSSTSEMRRTPLASSSTQSIQHKSATCFSSAFVNGAVSAAIVEEADQGANQYATQYQTKVGTQLPAGKYLPVGQDHLGFFYQAPTTFFVDESNLVTGGIYWRNATNGPGGIWYQWGSHKRPCVTYNRDIINELIVPRPPFKKPNSP
jgi:hypothetical protein